MRDGEVLEATVESVESKRVGEKKTPMLEVTVLVSDEGQATKLRCAIWLTEKSAGIARQQLKRCGFDIDAQDLSTLLAHPCPIRGRTVLGGVVIETYENNGSLYYRGLIEIGGGPGLPKSDLDEATKWMRESKKANRDKDADGVPSDPAARTALRTRLDEQNFDDIPF